MSGICEKCHDKIHKEKIELKRKKTTKGYILEVSDNNPELSVER